MDSAFDPREYVREVELAHHKVRENAHNDSGSRCLHISELAALPPPSFLIEGLYVEKTFSLLYGPPKSGKTHIGSQVCYDLALGTDHFGRKTKQTGVLILAGEGENAISLRARAFAKYHGAILQDMDIRVLSDRLDFLDKDIERTHEIILREYEKLINPGVIMIDPWGKFIRSGDENSSQDMGRAIETVRRLQQKADCSLFGVHHSPASTSQRPRGHTSLLADVELAASVTKTESTRTLTVMDARFIPEGQVLSFGLHIVELEGTELTACVVVPEDKATATKDTRKKRSPNEQIAWEALMHVFNKAGERDELISTNIPDEPVRKAVRLSSVRERFIAKYGDDGTSRTSAAHKARSRWSEAHRGLDSKGYCGIHGELVWPIFK